MGGDCGSWLPQQHPNWQSPNLNCYTASLDAEQQCAIPSYMNPETVRNMVSANVAFDPFAIPELPQPPTDLGSEPRSWFYCLPRFRQAFMPVSENVPREKHPSGPQENCRQAITLNEKSGCTQKRFLVFDHTGDQTTLIFNSGIEHPVNCLTSWLPSPLGTDDLNLKLPGVKSDLNNLLGPFLTDQLDENRGTDMKIEMHEDTEELNALLYSDDDSDSSEDDEVTSTGHSPGTMTAHDNHGWFLGSTEDVASSVGPTKKRKIINGGYEDLPSLVDTASSVKQSQSLEHQNDAESFCGNDRTPGLDEMGSSGNKKMRKEKIRETVSILQSIIPDGKGKDTIMVLDEAILYLKSLKIKARALGLSYI